jgi:hypothetical protein
MRKTIIAGNWKMYKTITQAIELANGLKRELFALDSQKIDIVICPPFTALSEVAEVIADSNIQLGAQDLHWQDEGAFTGEISAFMLKVSKLGKSIFVMEFSSFISPAAVAWAGVNNAISEMMIISMVLVIFPLQLSNAGRR